MGDGHTCGNGSSPGSLLHPCAAAWMSTMLAKTATLERNRIHVVLVGTLMRYVRSHSLEDGLYVVVDPNPCARRLRIPWLLPRFHHMTDAVVTSGGICLRVPCFVTTITGRCFLALSIHAHERNRRVHGRTIHHRTSRRVKCALTSVLTWSAVTLRNVAEAQQEWGRTFTERPFVPHPNSSVGNPFRVCHSYSYFSSAVVAHNDGVQKSLARTIHGDHLPFDTDYSGPSTNSPTRLASSPTQVVLFDIISMSHTDDSVPASNDHVWQSTNPTPLITYDTISLALN